ncbi:hypothetical protein Tco_0434902 [Tanacetum coccineum]
MSSITAQQTKLDLELVFPKRIGTDIGKCNGRISRRLTPREPTFQVILDAIALTLCYPAFLITADVPESLSERLVVLNKLVSPEYKSIGHVPSEKWWNYVESLERLRSPRLKTEYTKKQEKMLLPFVLYLTRFARKFKKLLQLRKNRIASVLSSLCDVPVLLGSLSDLRLMCSRMHCLNELMSLVHDARHLPRVPPSKLELSNVSSDSHLLRDRTLLLVLRCYLESSMDMSYLAKVISQPHSTYEAASTLTEFELKKIILDKMEKSESYLAAPEHRDCYDSLKKSYDLDKYFFFSYDVYSLKRSRKDKDKDEDPSARSDREPVFEVANSNMPQDQEGNMGDKEDEPRKETSSRCDWFKKPTPPQEPTDPDWTNIQTTQRVPFEYFINNDLKYLQGGVSTMTYMTSTTKTKAAQYDLPGIEDMVSNIWSSVKVAYDRYGSKHMVPDMVPNTLERTT